MRVRLYVEIREGDIWHGSTLSEREIEVQAEMDGLSAIRWSDLCGGLVEAALSEAMAVREEENEEEENDDPT